jgi:hypothetical protein
MIKLELNEKSANFLIRILENSLENYDLFTDVDEDSYEFFDKNFQDEILTIRNTLIKLKGLSNE